MKQHLLLSLVALLVISCDRNDHNNVDNVPKLETVKFFAAQADNGFSGAIELYPCTENTTNYVGNYHNDNISVIAPSCVLQNGHIINWGYQLFLPLGTYNMIYWGVANTPIYTPSRAKAPGIRLGADLSTLYWSLVPNSDKSTYMPVWDQVMAVQNVAIGSSDISVNLNRKVAGLRVIVKHSSGAAFDPAITGFEVLVGGIAEKINMATGMPENQTKTVKFNLTIDTARMAANNVVAMLYPSAAAPTITINVQLKNGHTKSYNTNIKSAFRANMIQNITILTADIFGSDPSTTFTVDNWEETSSTIDL